MNVIHKLDELQTLTDQLHALLVVLQIARDEDSGPVSDECADKCVWLAADMSKRLYTLSREMDWTAQNWPIPQTQQEG